MLKYLTPITFLMMLISLLACEHKAKTSLDNPTNEQITTTTDSVSEMSLVSGFKTAYHIHLKSDEDEATFVEITGVFNDLVEELGYQNVTFNFWKFTGEKQGKYGYIFESNWPDMETFDKVFEDDEFKNTLSDWYPKFTSMIAEGAYNKYVRMN